MSGLSLGLGLGISPHRGDASPELWDLDAANPVYWLSLHPQASAISELSFGVGISGVTDASGNEMQTATQSIASSQPAYQASGFNSFPSISFDGINHFLNFSVQQAFNQVVMAVLNTTNIQSSFRIILSRSGTNPAPYLNSGYSLIFDNGNLTAMQLLPSQKKAIFFWQIGGDASGFNKSDVDAKSIVQSSRTASSIGTWLGINDSVFDFWRANFKLSELAILNNPSQADIARIYGIWAHRWWRLAGQPVPLDPSFIYYSEPPLR